MVEGQPSQESQEFPPFFKCVFFKARNELVVCFVLFGGNPWDPRAAVLDGPENHPGDTYWKICFDASESRKLVTWEVWEWTDPICYLGGGFRYFVIFNPIPGEMINFDVSHIFQLGPRKKPARKLSI